MRASRWLVLSLAALLGTAAMAPAAQADTRVRIYLGLNDIGFGAGHQPYYRQDRSPVYVTYDSWGNRRYYRYAPQSRYYQQPRYYAPAPVYYYRPAPRPYYQDQRWDRRDNRHDRRDDRRRDNDRDGRWNDRGNGHGRR